MALTFELCETSHESLQNIYDHILQWGGGKGLEAHKHIKNFGVGNYISLENKIR